MATSVKDTEPLCAVSIINTERVLLVENVVFENVMPSIHPYLAPNQVDEISGEKTKFGKIRKILDYIERLTQASQYGAFNALMKAVAGTQPDLFHTLVGRAPTDTETIFCVKDIVHDIKNNIMKTGHCTDSELDETISFEYEHVELAVVGRNSISESTSELPHEYGDHLTRLQGTDRNIPACDILTRKSKPNEKVLVFGRPGVGKSTTTQWLARLWAQGKWATGISLLFLLQVRFLTNADVPITILQLLTLYSLYQLEDMADSSVLSSWLSSPASRILIFADGLDEIPGFASRMVNTRKISDLTHKALPIDLVVNILRGDLLPYSIVISASRPFLGLSELSVDFKAEVLGLTSKKVTEYVERRYPEEATHILSVLERNPILLSVCGITFYTMMISRLLSEGVVLIDEEVKTYTRLMAFILVQYTSRKITGSDFTLETNPYLAKLAKMAFSGIFQSQESTKLAKLVFDKKDLINFKLSKDLDCVKKTGIIQIRDHNIGGRKSVVAEFFHSSAQEMLGVLHFISGSTHSDDVLHQLFAGGHFDMALMYTFGLHFDRTSKWVDELWTAMGSSNPGVDTSISSQLSLLIDKLWKASESKMKACQLVYEGQWVDKAKEVFSHIAPDGKLSIERVTMTAIDILAVHFVCRCSGALTSVRLERVNADATFVKVLMSSMVSHNLSTLQKLDLSHNTIGAGGVIAIADSLSMDGTEPGADSPSLTTLDISYNRIGDEGAKAVAVLLHSNTSLSTLHISGNEIQGEGAEAIGEALTTNNSLTKLNIHNNQIGEVGAKAIAEALTTNTTLTVLHISHNQIGDVGAEAIAEPLTTNVYFTVLYISHNQIGGGAKAIAEALTTNTALTVLDISANQIGKVGAKVIAEALTTNTALTVLDISDSQIGDVGAEAIAEALTRNNSLNRLDINRNQIGEVGAKAIAEALTINNTLTRLYISYNRIGDVGAKAIAEALTINNTLTRLYISYNQIGDVGAKAIAEALTINNTLTLLGISVNPIGSDGKEALAAVRQHRPTLRIDI